MKEYLLYDSGSKEIPIKCWRYTDKQGISNYRVRYEKNRFRNYSHQNITVVANEILSRFYLYGGYGGDLYNKNLQGFIESLKKAEKDNFYVLGEKIISQTVERD